MNKNPAEFRLLLRYSIKKDGDWFIVSNDALDVVAQGESEEKALANFREVATLFVESCYRRGTLYDVLNQSAFPRRARVRRRYDGNTDAACGPG